MAGHLLAAGHGVCVWNRTAGKAERWAADHPAGARADSAADAAAGADIVFTCLGNDDDVASVLLVDGGALAAMGEGALLVDHTTTSPAMARRLAQACVDARIGFVDAPISGGQAGAENGTLAIMCGGSRQDFDRAETVMRAYGRRIVHTGDAGSGQATKMANQIAISGTLAGLSEAVRFAQGAGLDMDAVFEAISGGAAQSWQMDNRWNTMAAGEFDFGFAIDWMRKDLGYALAEGRARGVSLPIAALVDQFYAQVQAQGGGRLDTSALIRHLGDTEQGRD
jgi:3-hydroxyisobutyrate dehydrogenase